MLCACLSLRVGGRISKSELILNFIIIILILYSFVLSLTCGSAPRSFSRGIEAIRGQKANEQCVGQL